MQSVANIQIIREPEQSLAIGVDEKALSILPSEENAESVSENPLALVMKPTQIEKYGIQGWSYKTQEFSKTFDNVHGRLKLLVESGNFGGVLEEADQLIPVLPECISQKHIEIQKSCYQFFVHSKEDISTKSVEQFLKYIQKLDLESYAVDIPRRIDALKSEVLVKKILGTLGRKGEKALGNLRAQIGLAALLTEAKANSRKKNLSYSFTKHLMKAPIFLSSFAFNTNRCGSLADADKVNISNSENSPLALRYANQENKKTNFDGEDKHDNCQCDCGDPKCKPSDKCCVDINYFITDLLELREETYCYQSSDLAYIENIAPLEVRKRSHTFRKEVINYTEDETTETRSEERDHQVTDRSNVQKEIESQMSASLDVDAKVTGGTYTVDTSASLSRDTAQREAREKFREMVTKAVQKIQTQTRKLRTRQVTTESTETNVHEFVNTTSEHQVAKYFYVSQIKKGQVFSHGLRLMLEIMIPSPAANYLALEQKKAEGEFDVDEPEKPKLSPSDLTPSSFPDVDWNPEEKSFHSLWEYLLTEYELNELSPPPEPRPPISPKVTDPYFKDTAPGSLQVQEGYKAVKLEYAGGHANRTWAVGNATMELFVGSAMVWRKWTNSETSAPENMSDQGALTVSANHTATNGDAYIKGKVYFEALPVDYTDWQNAAHEAIMAKYQEDLAEYNRLLEEFKMKFKEGRKLMHPLTAEEHMRTQIKQSAIFMMCDDLNDNVMNMKTEPCGLPTFNRKASQEATGRWYFFDRAFDWRLSEFIFFDYFRNPICKWEDTFDPNEPNFLFKSFLRAGYARLQLPVAPGMEADVMSYLQDGTFWNGDEFPPGDPSDDRYKSVVSELKHSYGCRQNDRPGIVEAANGDDYVIIRNSEFYWDPGTNSNSGQVDLSLMELDEDREIFINGKRYKIVEVQHLGPNAAGTGQDWKVYLERSFEDITSLRYKHAVGAKHVGDPFFFELPTDLVWLGDMQNDDGSPNKSLPCSPNFPPI